MATLHVNGIPIYYRTYGQGKPLVLIMGFTANADWWPMPFIELLAEHFQVFLIDNRGAGRTPMGAQKFTITQAADDTAAFISAKGISKAHIFGISMGGMIAQSLAIRHPEKVNKLILGCTMKRPLIDILSSIPKMLGLVWGYATNKKIRSRRWVVNIMFSQAFLAQHPAMCEDFGQMAAIARIKRKSFRAQLLAMIRFNSTPGLENITAPVLILTGDCDRLIAPVNSQRLHKHLPHAQRRILKGCGHGFPGEQPIQSANLILSFLTTL